MEAKSGRTVHPDAAGQLTETAGDLGGAVKKVIVYGGDEEYTVRDCHILPWRKLESVI